MKLFVRLREDLFLFCSRSYLAGAERELVEIVLGTGVEWRR